ncbi:MAG: 4Fe-4S binding protein [Candidatus Micrarchaeia archaeon]
MLEKLIRCTAGVPFFPESLYFLSTLGLLAMIALALDAGLATGAREAASRIPLLSPLSQLISPLTILKLWWAVWLPLALLSVFLFSRAWCGLLCPLGAANEAGSALSGARKIPRALMNPWLPAAAFAGIFFLERSFGMMGIPSLSGAFFLLILIGAFATGLVSPRRSFCKFICPIGFLFGISARLAPFRLAPIQGKESEVERACGKSCPVFLNLGRAASAKDCLLCLRCAKSSPVEARVRLPGSELLEKDFQPVPSESIFIPLLAGLLIGMFALSPSNYSALDAVFPLSLPITTIALGSVNALSFFGFILFSAATTLGLARLAGGPDFLRFNHLHSPLVLSGLLAFAGEGILAWLGIPYWGKLALLSLGLVWSALLILAHNARPGFAATLRAGAPALLYANLVFSLLVWASLQW